jgi:hypothetical protein
LVVSNQALMGGIEKLEIALNDLLGCGQTQAVGCFKCLAL